MNLITRFIKVMYVIIVKFRLRHYLVYAKQYHSPISMGLIDKTPSNFDVTPWFIYGRYFTMRGVKKALQESPFSCVAGVSLIHNSVNQRVFCIKRYISA